MDMTSLSHRTSIGYSECMIIDQYLVSAFERSTLRMMPLFVHKIIVMYYICYIPSVSTTINDKKLIKWVRTYQKYSS